MIFKVSRLLINKTKILLIAFMLLLTWFVLTSLYKPTETAFRPDNLFCYADSITESLPDVSDHPPSMKKRNIFFIETSCNSSKNGKIYLSARQACAVESAARTNPEMDVYLLFASPGIVKDTRNESDRMLKVLSEYSNIKLMHFNMRKYVEDTKVEGLWVNGSIRKSNYQISHASDVLRFLTLWKYGGIYLDLDVIVTRNLSTLPENFAGAEEYYLGSAALGFGMHQNGREYISDCLEELKTNFNGRNWGFNGPQLITRVVLQRCPKLKKELLIRGGSCEDFVILPPSAFYLLPYQSWSMYFEEQYKDAVLSFAEKSSYLVHVWNKRRYTNPKRKRERTLLEFGNEILSWNRVPN